MVKRCLGVESSSPESIPPVRFVFVERVGDGELEPGSSNHQDPDVIGAMDLGRLRDSSPIRRPVGIVVVRIVPGQLNNIRTVVLHDVDLLVQVAPLRLQLLGNRIPVLAEEIEHVWPSKAQMTARSSKMRNLPTVGPVVNRLEIHLAKTGDLRRGEEIPGFSDARNHLNWVAAGV